MELRTNKIGELIYGSLFFYSLTIYNFVVKIINRVLKHIRPIYKHRAEILGGLLILAIIYLVAQAIVVVADFTTWLVRLCLY